jgi:hypothetical protein
MTLRAMGVLGVLALASEGARAPDHLASTLTVEGQVAAAARERERNLALLVAILESREAIKVEASIGTDPSHVGAALTHLSDAQIRDLAAKVRSLVHDRPVEADSAAAKSAVLMLISVLVLDATLPPRTKGISMIEDFVSPDEVRPTGVAKKRSWEAFERTICDGVGTVPCSVLPGTTYVLSLRSA